MKNQIETPAFHPNHILSHMYTSSKALVHFVKNHSYIGPFGDEERRDIVCKYVRDWGENRLSYLDFKNRLTSQEFIFLMCLMGINDIRALRDLTPCLSSLIEPEFGGK